MTISVNNSNNSAALIALQNLNNTQNELSLTENIVGSTVQVASAKDNPAIWSIAQNQNQQISGLDSVTMSLNRATSISDVATAAGQNVISLLNQLKQDALSAANDSSLDSTSVQALNSNFQSVLGQITNTINSASFDGANLLNGSSTGNLNILASADGSAFLTLSGQNLSLGGSVITVGATASLGTVTAAAAALSQVTASLTNVTTALADLGTQASQITAHTSFVSQLSDTLQVGVGDLVNANMGVESARLSALQVQQQLSIQALSVANQSPSAILSLFR
jgi:flagellin